MVEMRYFKIVLLVIALVLISSTAYSEEAEYREYKVLKGDTLWDISTKEIHDPFLWPKIWKENPEIKNPDLIYPSQTIKIPLKLIVKERPLEELPVIKPEPVKAEPEKKEPPKPVVTKIEPIRKHYLVDGDTLTAIGYITDYISSEVKNVGRITGAPTGRTLFGRDDYIYIKTQNPTNPGDKFYIIKAVKLVKHPVTNDRLGHLIEMRGVAEVVGIEDSKTKAKITKSFSDISVGDLLDNFYEIEPFMEEDNPRKPDITGVVVAIKQLKTISGYTDILFIDKGSSDGLEVGDLLKTISTDKSSKTRTTGTIQIISLKNSTAAAIIRNSEDVIRVGDKVSGLK